MEENVILITRNDFNSVCRVCLSSGHLINMFELFFDENAFVDIFSATLGFQVNLNDGLPENVCQSCIREVINFFNFKRNFEKSLQILQSISAGGRERANKLVDSLLANNIAKAVPDIVLIEDKIEEISLSDVEAKSSDSILLNNMFEDIPAINNSEDASPAQENVETSKTIKNIKLKAYRCYCKKTFAFYSEFLKHRKEENHTRNSHFPCTVCGKNIAPNHLKYHMYTHTKEKPYKCQLCPREFSHKYNLKRHIFIHTKEKNFICERCGRGFIQKNSFIRHKCIRIKEKSLVCGKCGIRCKNKLMYKFHVKEHNKSVKYLCHICSKTFLRRASFKAHLFKHEEKQFLCNICNKAFFNRHILNKHKLSHAEDKSFKCEICLKSFREKSHLILHLINHSGEKSYSCSSCNKTDSTNEKHEVHVHTSEDTFYK